MSTTTTCRSTRTDGASPSKGAPGLYHIAFRVGRTREALESARDECLAHGLVPFGEQPDGRTPCFCVRDPDGHEIELYVELSPPEGLSGVFALQPASGFR